ncbi:MAG: CPBP family intramembrane glutamic endopeptidase [Bermanella sp.]
MLNQVFLATGYVLISAVILRSLWLIDNHVNQSTKPLFLVCSTSILLFFLSGQLELFMVPVLLVFIGLGASLNKIKNPLLKTLLATLCVFICFALAAHLLPGIENYILYEQSVISEAAAPINIRANIDKALAGIILLLMLITLEFQAPAELNKPRYGLIPLYIASVLIVAYLTGLELDIKLPAETLAFIITNLLFSVIAEEALFRGIIQNGLIKILKDKTQFAVHLGIIITSLIFGLVHMGGGWHFVILATFAGLIYGTAYQLSNRLSVAIIAHLGVNVGHFLLLVYPVPK